MSHPIDYHFLAFYFEENPVASHPQPVFWGKVGEPLYIPCEVIRQGLDLFNYGAGFTPVNCFQVFDRSWFEFDFVDQFAAVQWPSSSVRPSRLRQVIC
jgi:hypothetical protein